MTITGEAIIDGVQERGAAGSFQAWNPGTDGKVCGGIRNPLSLRTRLYRPRDTRPH